ncbi:tripartite tricarboxylate transporter substrate binding protein (plasmid) [Cupriavidus necator]|uniref:Tripartite tricarboxylate transporter substrate binding protein n=1 Tax=Cupriavidus necator TaxID=106590 RepID=A0A1U9V2R8_CUPNE|nr:tripartite tricarboxylate transporter substrate binding protein [Cupriavidus necator]AQV99240.1 tripartite tricarboxylate transporter substrate binding protein [Cupriavidus necator]
MTNRRERLCSLALAAAAAFGWMGSATATGSCPGGYLRVVVPNPAGGVGDLIARTLGNQAGTDLGETVVIENRAGATTVIGTNVVAKSTPDGCTILSLTASGVVASVLQKKLPYDLTRDFVPIVGVGSFPMVIAVPASSKFHSVADLAKAAKAEGITYASGGVGSLAHLSAARLIKEWGGKGNHIPYKGNSDAIQGLLGDQIQLFFPSTAEAIPLVKAGKIRLLAVTSDARLPALPDVPTMKELGYADFKPRLWYAFLAPKGTPPTAVSRLTSAFAKAAASPDVKGKFSEMGFITDVKDPSAVSILMKGEAERWGKVIAENHIQASD